MKWLAALVLVAGCGPLKCQTLEIDLTNHPSKPVPAGRLAMRCNGKTVLEAEADNIQTGGK